MALGTCLVLEGLADLDDSTADLHRGGVASSYYSLLANFLLHKS